MASDLVQRLRASWRLLVRELSKFGVVGVVCFAIDVGLFQLLYAHAGWGAVTAKATSTIISMTVAYVAHRYWSFSHRGRQGVRREYTMFVLINGVTLALTIATIALVRYPLGQEGSLVLQVANIGSIVVGTVIRYLGYRAWVFPPANPPHVATEHVIDQQETARQA